jgi:hypothetical protein
MKKTITLNIPSEMHATVTDGKVMLKYAHPTPGYDFKRLLTLELSISTCFRT